MKIADRDPAASYLRGHTRHTLDLASSFISAYMASREGLKKLGVLRTDRNLQGDYAEWLASKLFDLKLSLNTVQAWWDATDSRGRRYQIKSRMVACLSERTLFDFLLCVFFTRSLDLLGILKVSSRVARELGHQNRGSFRFRWNKQTAADPRVKKLVWEGGDAPVGSELR